MATAPVAPVVPMTFNSFVPDDSVYPWLTSALPLLLAPWVAEALAVPVVPPWRCWCVAHGI
jgi:hypothetical protein